MQPHLFIYFVSKAFFHLARWQGRGVEGRGAEGGGLFNNVLLIAVHYQQALTLFQLFDCFLGIRANFIVIHCIANG